MWGRLREGMFEGDSWASLRLAEIKRWPAAVRKVLDGRVAVFSLLVVVTLLSLWFQVTGDPLLRQTLADVATPKRVVIVTVFTSAWKDMLDLWLYRLNKVPDRPMNFGSHVLVLTLDKGAYEYCQALNIRCYYDDQADAVEPFQYSGDEVRFDTPAYIAMSWRRLEVIRKIMHDGYHVVFSDLDAIWLKTPPFPFALQKNNWADMLLTMDRWYPDLDDIAPNSGLWFMRNTWRSRTFLKHWLDARSDLARGKRDQYALTSLLPAINEGVQHKIGINMLYVRPSVGGCMCDVPTSFVELSTIHADCITGLEEKLAALTSFLERYEKGYKHYVDFSKQVISKDLQSVAQEAMLPNKVVLTTSFLASEKPLLELFVDRLRKMKDKAIFADHFLVLTFDMAAYYYCNEMGLRCYFDSEAFPNMEPKDIYALRDLEKMVVWRRLAVLETILNLEFKVLYSHPSVMWLKDPIPRVLSATHDMGIHCDRWSDIQAAASGNTSFWFMRNNGQAKQFLRRWMEGHKMWPDLDDQQVFAKIRPEVDEFSRKSINIHVAYLPSSEFGSFCQPTEKVEDLLTIHGVCVSYKERLGKLKEFLGRYDSGTKPDSGEETKKISGN